MTARVHLIGAPHSKSHAANPGGNPAESPRIVPPLEILPARQKGRQHPGAKLFRLCLGLAILTASCLGGQTSISATDRPNIVLINLDDADIDMFRPEILESRFPHIDSVARQGITFTNFHVTSPLCGPSRACLLRGQYAHALGHRTNNESIPRRTRGFQGDIRSFFDRGFADDDFGKWLQDAGYHTIFLGKYINNTTGHDPRIPAGWDDFFLSRGSRYYETERFTNRVHPEGAFEFLPKGVYRTHAEGLDLAQLIRSQSSNPEPLFVYFAPYGPHSEGQSPGGMIDTSLSTIWPNLSRPREDNYDEADISDKPLVYRQLPPIPPAMEERMRNQHRRRMIAAKSVDIAIGRVLRALSDTGRLENTFVMITSDNGYLLGQHRLSAKGVTFREASQVPLIVQGPGVPANATANHLLAHIDIAPTLLELAGHPVKPFIDGKSFLPLLNQPENFPPESWRQGVLIENWQRKLHRGYPLNTTFLQLRMYDSVFTEWADGTREFYDLQVDPLQLENVAESLTPDDVEDLRDLMKSYRRPLPDPIVTIEAPLKNFGYLPGPPFHIKGVAEASSGVHRVGLVIRNLTSNTFWSGSDWQEERVMVEANLTAPGGVLSEWTYHFSPTATDDLGETYSVVARTYSESGRHTRNVVVRRFRYDSLPPITSIEQVEIESNRRLAAVGAAFDNDQVKRVRIHLVNEDNHYFDGEKFVPQTAHLQVPVDEAGQWTWRSARIPQGTYILRARSQDQAGNWDSPPAVKTILVE